MEILWLSSTYLVNLFCIGTLMLSTALLLEVYDTYQNMKRSWGLGVARAWLQNESGRVIMSCMVLVLSIVLLVIM